MMETGVRAKTIGRVNRADSHFSQEQTAIIGNAKSIPSGAKSEKIPEDFRNLDSRSLLRWRYELKSRW